MSFGTEDVAPQNCQPYHHKIRQDLLQLGDWLLLLEPLIADMSMTSELWWKQMTTKAEKWYQRHVAMTPLERIQHQPTPPEILQQEKWQRLERRISVIILNAIIPDAIREQMEESMRQTLLKNMEEPVEVTSLVEAPAAIRTWLRWRRAEEIGAVAPDPALLLKGLNRLTRRVIESNKELQFKASPVRSNLGVDTTPTANTVG
eukprot:s48_g34.t1